MKTKSNSTLNDLSPLDPVNFNLLKKGEFTHGHDLVGMKLLRNTARNERDLRELYRGRAQYELLQNADDARASRALFILTNEGLVFVHDGDWFTVANFRSLADGWSDKDPNQCIGHKGLGFRSVLDITPSPYLIQVNKDAFFGIKFSWALNNGYFQNAFHLDPALRKHYLDWTKHGRSACPIMYIPGEAKIVNLGMAKDIFNAVVNGDYKHTFTTFFWFPATDPDIDHGVLQELSPMPITSNEMGKDRMTKFITDEVSTLLQFLNNIKRIDVYEGSQRLAIAEIIPAEDDASSNVISTSIATREVEYPTQHYFRMHFECPINDEIKQIPDMPTALKQMDKANFMLSVRLENARPIHDDKSKFHVYFPTNDPTGAGFTIHGDFHVEPDRERLMQGQYNTWLIDMAAYSTANEFLTELLEHYEAKDVFEALSPSISQGGELCQVFLTSLSKYLMERQQPFIPSTVGLSNREGVILPPHVDEQGFWNDHFGSDLSKIFQSEMHFIDPKVDGPGTRKFLHLAGLNPINSTELLDYMENSTSCNLKNMQWWYDCYKFLAEDLELSRLDNSSYAGRKLLPIDDGTIAKVPNKIEKELIVTLPPKGDISKLAAPHSFASVFTILNPDLADLLEDGSDSVSSWVLQKLNISRFEASELLPRAIQKIAPQIFSENLNVTQEALIEIWCFLKSVIESSRVTITSKDFWEDVGRFPIPLIEPGANNGTYTMDSLIPAFLCYFPDEWIEQENCLTGITTLDRIDIKFLKLLLSKSGSTKSSWITFLKQVGVTDAPKLLKYKMVLGSDVIFGPNLSKEGISKKYTGERQNDINTTVISTILKEDLWPEYYNSIIKCNHNSQVILHSLSVLQAFNECVTKAYQEFKADTTFWKNRLWFLIQKLPTASLSNISDDYDRLLCRGGKTGHEIIQPDTYVQLQIKRHMWVPTSKGPCCYENCFARSVSRRLISLGTSNEELGDILLPYVIFENIDQLSKLQMLGVEVLDDAEQARPQTLIRALRMINEQLYSEWGNTNIVKSPRRWRLIRGAVQDIYGKLNQAPNTGGFPKDMKFAVRCIDGINYGIAPLYYADPGSALEQSFKKLMPLFDADRVYRNLFNNIPVRRLTSSGEERTVEESIETDSQPVSLEKVRNECINSLAPFFLAPVIARTEKLREIDIVVNRLKQRFEVKQVENLRIKFKLIADDSISCDIENKRLYLQRRILPGSRGGEEAHFTLFIAGKNIDSIEDTDIDADLLGQTLAPLFFDYSVTEDIASLFPRIANKYQSTHGNAQLMRDFLFHQLNVSLEAQDRALGLIAGEDIITDQLNIPPAPPIVIPTPQASEIPKDFINIQQQAIQKKIENFVANFGSQDANTGQPTPSSGGKKLGPTSEQKKSGLTGEEEIKRRLQLPGGWGGFEFMEDKRNIYCGYDYLCACGSRQIYMEVKTFKPNGRIIITGEELKAASQTKNDYYLIGVIDEGKNPEKWTTFCINNPIDLLFQHGSWDIDMKLQVPVTNLFKDMPGNT